MNELVAGDLSRLTEDALAAAREFVALTALARQSDPSASNAGRVLSGCAGDPDAFAWLWALVQERGDRWHYVELPDVLAVPPRLEGEVADWVLSTQNPQHAGYGQPSLAGFAGNVLVRLPDPLKIDLAKRAVSGDAGANSSHVRSVAMQVLGASRDPEGRSLVLRMVQQMPAEGQARAFADLQPPHSPEEQAALVAAVQASRRIAIDGSAVPSVARVVGWLSPTDIAAYLREAHPESRAQVLQPLVSALDLEVLKDLIGGDLGEEAAQQVLGHAANRAEAPELGSYAYSTVPSRWCAGFWQKYATWARSNTSWAPDRREQAVAALWDFTFATAADDLAQPMSELVDQGEVLAMAQQVSAEPDESRAQRLGAVAGHLLDNEAEQWTDEVIAAGDILPDIYWQGVSSTISEQIDLSPKIIASAKQSPGALRAWSANGFSSQLQANMQSACEALALLEAAHEHLSDDNVAELFGIATWTSVSHAEYLRVVRLFDDRLPVLATQLVLAISSLQGREALAAPPNLISDLLELSLAAGLRAEIEDPLAAVQLLLDQPDDEVVERTCAWIRALELDPGHPEVDHGIIAAVMAADDARSHLLSCLARLRLDLGDRLAALALDQTQMTSRRIEHLQLGVRVLPTSARVAAFELASSSTKDLRAAAADVLAETPGDSSELTRLEDLIKAEPIDSIRNGMNQARHRISSGGIGEALAALVELLDLTHEIGPIDPTVLVPNPDHHERLIAWIDKARARADNTHDPGTFIEAAINVADQMVDLALIAATEAGQPTHLKPAEVAALRANSSVRLDTGALLGRQQLQQIVAWLPTCTVLRRKRGAHPSPSGSTRPQIIMVEDLITARSLLKDITSGWILDMRRFAISV